MKDQEAMVMNTMTPLPIRPNCWTFDFKAVVTPESGYCTAESSTENENPPTSWPDVGENLEAAASKLELIQDVQVSLDLCDPVQEHMNTFTNCSFTVQIDANSKSDYNYSKVFEYLEALVEGPSGRPYQVTQTLGNDPSKIVCSYRALESGHYTCNVKMNSSLCVNPSPFIMTISRQYEYHCETQPICSMDVELLTKNPNIMEKRKPWGVCSNTKTEQILVADREQHQILILNAEGDLVSKFGCRGNEPGEFFRPTAIAYDSVRDRILVTDKDNHRIQIFTPKGEYITHFGRKGNYPGQFYFPWDVAVSNDGEFIVVADSRNHRIQLFDSNFNFIRQYSAKQTRPQSWKQDFDYPRGICFDSKGENVFVTDFNLHRLFKLDIYFTHCKTILNGDTLKRPQGIAIDSADNIILCDSRNNAIKIVETDGTIIADIRKLGDTAVDLPLDVTLMKAGHVAILDLNGRVQIV